MGTAKPINTLSSSVCEGGHNARPAFWLLLLFSRNAGGSTEMTANRAKQSHPLYRWQPAADSHTAAAHCSLPVPCQRALQAEHIDHHLAVHPRLHQPCARPASEPGTRHPTRLQQSNGLLNQGNRSRRGQRRFSVAGALLWNALPGEVHTITGLPEFNLLSPGPLKTSAT